MNKLSKIVYPKNPVIKSLVPQFNFKNFRRYTIQNELYAVHIGYAILYIL
jgi:hypothetical protein